MLSPEYSWNIAHVKHPSIYPNDTIYKLNTETNKWKEFIIQQCDSFKISVFIGDEYD
jgi:hypothetical protein